MTIKPFSTKPVANASQEKCSNRSIIDIETVKKQLKYVKDTITVEPLFICYVTAKAVCEPALKNLELEKACRVNAKFNDSVCSAIISGSYAEQNFTGQNDYVQSYVTDLHSWQIMVSNLLTIIVMVLLGSCSDRYKIRKPFLLFSVVGQFVEFSGCLLCTEFMMEWPLQVQGVAQEVVLALFGGEKLLLTVTFAYIADVSTTKMRTVRVAFVQALYNICYGGGQAFSGALLAINGYRLILSTGLALCAIGFFYGIFCIEESKRSEKVTDKKAIFLDSFNPRHITEPFKLFVKYKGSTRVNIICMFFVIWMNSTIYTGEQNVMFLFTETAYGWTVKEYSYFMTITTIANTIGLTFIVPLFTKVLQLNDLIIVALSAVNKIVTNTIFMIFTSSLGLYVGCSIGVLKTISLVGIRSQLTKYVSESDTCKILSLYTVMDSLSEALASDIYNEGIYGQTRTTFPQAFFLLGIALSVLIIAVLMCMYYKARNASTNEEVQKTEEANCGNVALETEVTHL